MTEQERNEYLKAYYDNEADANRHMSFANAVGGLFMLVLWILYLTGAFLSSDAMRVLVNIIFPIGIGILFTPLLYVYPLKKKNFLRKPRYKYFVIFSFILVVAAINIIIPKHGLLGWVLPIVMTNHFYNPKLGRATFITVMVLMLVCMYLGMFVGEYDPHLSGNGVIQDGLIVYPDGIKERFDILHQEMLSGDNRYWKILVFYYLPRGGILSLIFFVSNALNKRTYNLLVKEIQTNSAQEKTRTELEVAKEIQLQTLPSELLANRDIEIQAELKAAKAVGGDFYDYFVLDKDHVALVIGDVSGKGIPAAMFMMKTITCFKNQVSADKTPSEILKAVNKTLHDRNDSGMFVTCLLAIIDTKTGHVRFANAGHNPPIVGTNKTFRFLPCKTGFVLGGLEDAFVEDEETTLNPGEAILLYTDGITEARNAKGEFYGQDRLLNGLNRKVHSCLLELLHTLKDEVLEFVGDAEQSDDMTYIALKFHGDEYRYEEKTFDGKLESVPKMLEFLKKFGEKNDFEQGFVNNLMVVGDELLSNSIKYGYKDQAGDIFLRVLYNVDRKEFALTIIDKGVDFDPFSVDDKPLEGDISHRKEGGLGILIVKKLMSEYAYDRINGKNIVTLKKRF